MKQIVPKLKKLIASAYMMSDENYSVFVNYSPHVELVAVRIHSRGWEEDDDYDIKADIHLDREDAEKQLDDVIRVISLGYHEAMALMEFGEER